MPVFQLAPALQVGHLQAAPQQLLADSCVLAVLASGVDDADAIDDPRLFEIGAPTLTNRTGIVEAPMCQVLRSERPVRRWQDGDLHAVGDGDYLFASCQLDAQQDLASASRAAYLRLLRGTQMAGYPQLLRTWNYLPDINEGSGDEERYRRFCLGRYRAFAEAARVPTYPAASALGLSKGNARIALLASRFPGAAIENPHQLSAFRYPREYGPASPSFSRACLLPNAAGDLLFVSGTAAITGHRSMHEGDLGAQLQLSLANIAEVAEVASVGTGRSVDRAAASGFARIAPSAPEVQLRVYLRSAADLANAQAQLRALLPLPFSVEWLRADICRRELLIEVEAVLCWPRQ